MGVEKLVPSLESCVFLWYLREETWDTIDTEIKAKRNNIISELVTFRTTTAKAKIKLKYLCGHKCKRSSAHPININTKSKSKKYFRGINITSISVSTVSWEFARGLSTVCAKQVCGHFRAPNICTHESCLSAS